MASLAYKNGRQKLHIWRFITLFSVGVVLGIGLALPASRPYFDFEFLIISTLILVLTVILRRSRAMFIIALIAGISLGFSVGYGEKSELALHNKYVGQDVVIEGRVSDDIIIGTKNDQRIKLSNVTINNQNLPGKIWLNTNQQTDIKRGDVVVASGELNEGFGMVASSIFRADIQEVVRPEPGDIARRVRDWLVLGIQKIIPEPEASLGIGYLLGQKQFLNDELNQQLRLLGLTHVVVASGYHLTVIIRLIRRFSMKISRYTTVIMGVLVIIGFLLLTGFNASMVRAALMTGISLVFWYFGRKIHPFLLISFVAALMAVLDPVSVWADVGWYLSFTAFIGVVLLAPLLHGYFWGVNNKPGYMRELLVTTFAAQVTTFPLVAFVFGSYAPLGLITNALVLPLVPFVMATTLIAGLVGNLTPFLAPIAYAISYSPLKYMTFAVDLLSSLPFAGGDIGFGVFDLVLSYIVILVVFIYLRKKTKHNFKNDSVV